jgi:hypothetical protein
VSPANKQTPNMHNKEATTNQANKRTNKQANICSPEQKPQEGFGKQKKQKTYKPKANTQIKKHTNREANKKINEQIKQQRNKTTNKHFLISIVFCFVLSFRSVLASYVLRLSCFFVHVVYSYHLFFHNVVFFFHSLVF